MSVYARVERFGSKTMLLYLRGVSNTVGENAAGILSTTSIVRPFFAIHAVDSSYVLVADTLRLSVNGERFEPFTRQQLQSGDTITCSDYTFHIAVTSALAETLARSELSGATLLELAPDPQILASATLRLATLSRVFPIVPNATLVVGRDRSVGIPIDLDGIAGEHCALTIVDTHVVVTPRKGKISVDNLPVTGPTPIQHGGILRLLPLGVALTITYTGMTP